MKLNLFIFSSNLMNLPYSAVDGEFVDDIEVLDHLRELIEGDLSVLVGIGLYYGPINKLLQLDVVQVVADHHLQHLEELTVRDVAIIIDVVNLECESQLLFVSGPGREGIEALHELKERDGTILVLIKNSNDPFNKRVVGQL